MFIKTCFTGIVIFLCLQSKAQTFDIEEKTPYADNGFEYGYIIKNEQIKKAGDEEYNRYEITFYITNKSGCTKIYEDRSYSSSSSYSSAVQLATFNCQNANGKRFTSKSINIAAKEFYINVKKKVDGKTVTENVKAGYIFRKGETLKSNAIVLVPKGERPVIQCSAESPQELD
ncbi:MAG: hypothetical protein V4685_12150 [Bacteroidota bacterium]